jgi:phage tail protein X
MTDTTASTLKKVSLAAFLGEEDISKAPSAYFPKLREGQAYLVSRYMRSYHASGGLHYLPHLSDAEIAARNAANPGLAPWVRVADLVMPEAVAGNAQAGTVENHRELKKQYAEFNDMMADLMTQTIMVLGPLLRDGLQNAHPDLASMTNLQLQTWLHTNIGVATDQDLQVLRDATKAPFTHSTMFAQEAAKLNSLFVLMAQLNAPISNYEQICQLYDNVQHLPHVLHAVERYRLSTATNARTYPDLVRAVTTDLQRNPERVETSASDGGYVGVALRYAVPHLATSQANLASASASVAAAGGGRGNDTSGRGRAGRGGRGGRGAGRTVYGPGGGAKQPVPPTTMLYCFAHGMNSTHNGMNCRFMAQNPAYTDSMKRATCYCVIDGYPGAPSTI